MARGDTGRERLSRTEQADAGIHHMGEALGTEGQSLGTESQSASLSMGSAQLRSGQDSGPGDWRLSNWRLRTKLLAVLLIPLLSAIVFGGLHIYDGVSEARRLDQTHQQVNLQRAADDLTHELQRERDLSVSYVAGGRSGDAAPLADVRTKVDAELDEFRGLIGGYDDSIASEYRIAADNLNSRLASLRDSVDNTQYPPEGVLRTYSQSIDSLLDLGQQGVSNISDSNLLRLTLATNAIADAQEAASLRAALLNDAIRAGQFRTDQNRELLAAEARIETAVSDFNAVATEAQRQLYQDSVTGADVDRANSMSQSALAFDSGGQPLNSLDAQEWDKVANTSVDLIDQVGGKLHDSLDAAADDAAAGAQQRTIAISVATLLALVVALAVALVVARSLLGSLRTLRRSALDVADRGLPEAVRAILNESGSGGGGLAQIEPIPVYSREEIGKVARSFDAVHSQALRLASEQALLRNNVNDLFVNLARRSQTLVQRQLSLIDRLEQDEQDPDQLSSLFELDHLATRMRRNNENLLILGGTDLTRRMMRPVPLTEVVGAAVSEVEQYTRVSVADSPDLAIQGRVVNDFVHLVAELLENATVFSNPDTEVTVRTAYRRQELVLEIRDRGVGIDAAELGEINERLTRPPEIDVAVSRRMGLYVVGQLARRHDIRVDLRNNGDLEGGVTASVRVSGEFVVQLTPDGPRPMPDVQRVAADDRDSADTGTNLGLAAAFGGAAANGRAADSSSQLSPVDPAELEQPAEQSRTSQVPVSGNGHGGIEKTHVSPVWITEDDDPVPDLDFAAPAEEPERPEPAATREPEVEQQDVEWQDADEEQQAAEESAPGDYSFRVATGDSFGVTDVPRWHTAEQAAIRDAEPQAPRPAEPQAPRPAEQTSEVWPNEETRDPDFDGQCGVPPGLDAPQLGEDVTTTSGRAESGPQDLFHSPYEAEKTQQISLPPDDFDWGAGAPAEPEQAAGTNGAGTTPPPLGYAHQARREGDDAPTERLPIYEAVLSQWFREGSDEPTPEATAPSAGSMPLDAETAAEAPEAPESPEEPAPATGRRKARREAEEKQAEPLSGSDPLDTTGSSGAGGESRADTGGHILAGPHDPGWGSADVGWQAAEALVAQTRQTQETTAAGLPKRVPKSNLVPGSAAPRSQSPAPVKPAAPRSADAVRGRMSNFQSGVRRGRHAKAEPVSTEPPRSTPSRPEEQE
ncbi:nitrate- and nitrite sensing domain-containing protein [Saccharopolyspora sp. 6V]|uniref:nitrate- and nitrite sensing domain-containing protein n=1 Tax=Saccharopolyspora sp. 6V TaxID=2877239 RepID=UPI001CD6D310|nr:nitrate- and nitrite sensing domain-containing protein [Saccharopolyspora sp. 6V]MCA1193539.1 nitrate- and nitrite sensing domain-containing protein [Saccharopolyspora sp. 6V]